MDSVVKKAESLHEVDFLHEIGSRMAAADSLDSILQRILQFISDLVRCDSCFVYIQQNDQLVLSASKNPHSDLLNKLEIAVGRVLRGGWRSTARRWRYHRMRRAIRGSGDLTVCRRTCLRRFFRCRFFLGAGLWGSSTCIASAAAPPHGPGDSVDLHDWVSGRGGAGAGPH